MPQPVLGEPGTSSHAWASGAKEFSGDFALSSNPARFHHLDMEVAQALRPVAIGFQPHITLLDLPGPMARSTRAMRL